MTRLFIRFYVSVVIVLFLAWYIYGLVLQRRSDADWARVVEEAHGGGARLVARELNAVPPETRDQRLKKINEKFDYLVDVVALTDLPDPLQKRISNGADVASFRAMGVVIATLGNGSEVVQLGPFPDYTFLSIENSISGWMRLIASKIDVAPPNEHAGILKDLQQQFDIPITIEKNAELSDWPRQRIAEGANAVVFAEEEHVGEPRNWFAVATLTSKSDLVRVGPFPSFEESEPKAATTTLSLVLFPAALAIALLLRPMARQLSHVENAAKAIAAGDFSARVDERSIGEAKPLASAFNNMAGRTERLLRTQRELLQAVSHELRTPLARMGFAIDLTRDAKTAQEREERLQSLEDATEDLNALVEELLRYVRLEDSLPKLAIEDIELFSVVETLINKYALTMPTVEFEIGAGLRDGNIVVRAERVSLARVLSNLLANAGRFSQSRVVVEAHRKEDGIVITVDDDGPGIPEGDRDRVFEPFVRLNESGNGVGLGLALVLRIVRGHDGVVAVDTSPLGGCQMQVVWPESKTPA